MSYPSYLRLLSPPCHPLSLSLSLSLYFLFSSFMYIFLSLFVYPSFVSVTARSFVSVFRIMLRANQCPAVPPFIPPSLPPGLHPSSSVGQRGKQKLFFSLCRSATRMHLHDLQKTVKRITKRALRDAFLSTFEFANTDDIPVGLQRARARARFRVYAILRARM